MIMTKVGVIKVGKGKFLTYKRKRLKITVDFPSKRASKKRMEENILNVGKKICQPRILHPMELSFKSKGIKNLKGINEDKIKSFIIVNWSKKKSVIKVIIVIMYWVIIVYKLVRWMTTMS